MGPVRTGLAVLTGLAPSAALAEACAVMRPGWDGTQATEMTEALTLLLSPLGLLLLALTIFATRFRSKWLGVAAVVGWTGFVSINTAFDPLGLRPGAIAEGCVGPPWLFILIATGLSAALILYTTGRKSGTTHGDT